jgi:hypothetical protein
MTTKNTTTDLLTETHNLVANLQPLFYNLLATSSHHKLDTIQISTARATEIAMDLMILKKKLQSLKDSERIAESTTDRHLDEMFGLN